MPGPREGGCPEGAGIVYTLLVFVRTKGGATAESVSCPGPGRD
jgi:hypothetical protein